LACNRCSGGSHSSGIRADPGEVATGAGGAGPEEVAEEDMVDCPDHTPCNFMKGKPWSIISLLISKIHLSIYVIYIYIYIDALSYRC
jgi:formate-dependent nitrite reductase cytochrome c552 subunit